MEKRMDIRSLCKAALCTALLCISAYIAFPLPFSPTLVTAQTIVITLIGLLLPPLQAAASVAVYILVGCVGLPVFSGGAAGIGQLVSPSGGYIFGFLLSAVVISLLKGSRPNLVRYLIVSILAGIPDVYLLGVPGMLLFAKIPLGWELFTASVFPFLPGDIFKAVVACLMAVALEKAWKRMPATN